jgi:hypothetical protein
MCEQLLHVGVQPLQALLLGKRNGEEEQLPVEQSLKLLEVTPRSATDRE